MQNKGKHMLFAFPGLAWMTVLQGDALNKVKGRLYIVTRVWGRESIAGCDTYAFKVDISNKKGMKTSSNQTKYSPLPGHYIYYHAFILSYGINFALSPHSTRGSVNQMCTAVQELLAISTIYHSLMSCPSKNFNLLITGHTHWEGVAKLQNSNPTAEDNGGQTMPTTLQVMRTPSWGTPHVMRTPSVGRTSVHNLYGHPGVCEQTGDTAWYGILKTRTPRCLYCEQNWANYCKITKGIDLSWTAWIYPDWTAEHGSIKTARYCTCSMTQHDSGMLIAWVHYTLPFQLYNICCSPACCCSPDLCSL